MKSLYITGDKIEDREYYDNYLGLLFSKCFCKVKPKEFPYWNVYGISCYKKEIIRKCLKLGLQPGIKALTAKVPSIVSNSKDKGILKAFLRGIFDTDGSFWCERSRTKTSMEWKRSHNIIQKCKLVLAQSTYS